MKISLVCPASLPATQFGGIMFLCIHIANRLAGNNNQVTIYTTDLDFANNANAFNKNLPREETINGFRIKRTHVWFSLFLFYVNPGMYFQMLKDDHDIIHTVGVRSFQSLIATLISKKKKIPLIVSDQGGLTTHPDLQKSGLLKKILIKLQDPMIKFVINQCSKVIVANEYEKKIFLNFCEPSKIEIVRNGIDLDELSSERIDFRAKHGISGEFILFVGRFSKVKGIDVLLIREDGSTFSVDVKNNLKPDNSFYVETDFDGWLFNPDYTNEFVSHVNPTTGVIATYLRKRMQDYIRRNYWDWDTLQLLKLEKTDAGLDFIRWTFTKDIP